MLFLSLLTALLLVAAACAEDDPADEAEEPVDDAEEPEEGALEGVDISIAWIPWEENIAVANMWQAILEEEGATVTLNQYDVAPAFASVAGGEEDLFMDMWLPGTHASYQEEFGDRLEDYGAWFEEATLELTVPTYVADEHGITSLEDLADNADLFDNQIQGIEAGAGMMGILANDVVPGYGLDDAGFNIVEASTPAMRVELARAIEDQQPIVVTLWTPHPEYGLHDLTRLEDPQGLWGEAEQIHVVGREGFSDDHPEIAQWMENWSMTDEELSSINAAIDEADEGEWQDVAREWVQENRDTVDSWLGR